MYSGCKWLFQIRRVQPACGFPQTAALAIPRLQGTPPTTSTYPAPLRTLSRVHSCVQNCPSNLLFDLVTRNIISPTSTRLRIRYRENTFAPEIDIRYSLFIEQNVCWFSRVLTVPLFLATSENFTPLSWDTWKRRPTLNLLKTMKRKSLKIKDETNVTIITFRYLVNFV